MKKLFFYLIVMLFVPLISYSQSPGWQCATMEELEKQKKENPQVEEMMRLFEEQAQLWIKEHYGSKNSKDKIQTDIVIPVVVHMIYNNKISEESQDDDYITADEIIEQIRLTNLDFLGQNPNDMHLFPSTLKANTGFQFCLAQKAPDGSPTIGIEWYPTYVDEFGQGDFMKYDYFGGVKAWDPKHYFNIWICNTPGHVCWAQFPGSGVNQTYGVVVDYGVFGPNAIPGFNKGSITTHEIGHCFNLRHIWGDDQGACSGDDFCDDIPNQANYTSGNPTDPWLVDACTRTSPGIMFMNFMDYTNNDCAANFTPNQTARMQACFAPGASLSVLLNSTACSYIAGECLVPNSLTVTNLKKYSATLNWTDMVSAPAYNVRYRRSNSSTWTTFSTPENFLNLVGLSRNTPYEFQVQAVCQGNGTSEYSYSYSFITPRNDPPTSLTAPVLSSPANNATNISLNATLSWQAVTGASQYIILVSQSDDFSACRLYYTSSTSYTLTNLPELTTYYWKVRARYSSLLSDYSIPRSFTTGNLDIIPPDLRLPSNNATNISTSPTLSWYAVAGADRYNFECSRSSDFSNPIQAFDITSTSKSLTGLSRRTTYYWRVNAEFGGTTSDWSATWQFKTANSGKIAFEDELIEKGTATLEFFPNPVNETTHFRLEVINPDDINIEITNILGVKMTSLISGYQKAGIYEFDLDAGNYPTGVYYCRFTNGNEVKTLQMIIIK